jgi:hypothetical protein
MSDVDTSMLDHCSARQLNELLSLASNDTQITGNWLVEVGSAGQLEHLLTEICAGTGESGGKLVQAVCSPETPVETLIAIKSTAKRLAGAAKAPAQKAAATLLYHLSVAAALGYHGRNTSSKDPAHRLPLYTDLAAELSDDDLAAVFEKALVRFTAPT